MSFEEQTGLMPQRAERESRRTVGRDDPVEAVLELLPVAVIRVAADMSIRSANRKARHLLGEEDGLYARKSHLLAWQPKDEMSLGDAVRLACLAKNAQSSQLPIRRRGSPVPLMISVVPLAATNTSGLSHAEEGETTARYASLIFQDPDAGWEDGLAHLSAVFGVTAAECKLAGALMNAEPPQAYAQRTGITLHTLRSHMSALLKKTGTRRQPQLVRLLMLMRPLI